MEPSQLRRTTHSMQWSKRLKIPEIPTAPSASAVLQVLVPPALVPVPSNLAHSPRVASSWEGRSYLKSRPTMGLSRSREQPTRQRDTSTGTIQSWEALATIRVQQPSLIRIPRLIESKKVR